MGWKGVMRSAIAAGRRAERNSIRRAKKNQKLYHQTQKLVAATQAQAQKMLVATQAKIEVKLHEDLVERMITLHRKSPNLINWNSDLNSKPPVEPVWRKNREENARRDFESYKPNFFVKLFKLESAKRSNLEARISIASAADEEEYKIFLHTYQQELAAYVLKREFADRILKGDIAAYSDAIVERSCFESDDELNKRVVPIFLNSHVVEVIFQIKGPEYMPNTTKILLKSGKVSEKEMSLSKFNSSYQDYVASGALRIAREFFAIIPIEKIYLHAVDNILDPSTGHLSQQAVLSIVIPRKTMDVINFDTIDPSEALKNFNHNMEFKSTVGFKPIEKIKALL